MLLCRLDGLVDSQLVFPPRRSCQVGSAFCRAEFGSMFSLALPVHLGQDCWKFASFSFGSSMSALALPVAFSLALASLLHTMLPNYTPENTLWIYPFWDKTANLDLLSAWPLPLWAKSFWRVFAQLEVGLWAETCHTVVQQGPTSPVWAILWICIQSCWQRSI